jgi:hypothetical protein
MFELIVVDHDTTAALSCDFSFDHRQNSARAGAKHGIGQ